MQAENGSNIRDPQSIVQVEILTRCARTNSSHARNTIIARAGPSKVSGVWPVAGKLWSKRVRGYVSTSPACLTPRSKVSVKNGRRQRYLRNRMPVCDGGGSQEFNYYQLCASNSSCYYLPFQYRTYASTQGLSTLHASSYTLSSDLQRLICSIIYPASGTSGHREI